jgi:site-specific recombinase XerD
VWLKCDCPLWADGYGSGKRMLQSLGTRDMARARKKAIALDEKEEVFKPVAEAVKAFLAHCANEGLQVSTLQKYRNPLNKLVAFCKDEEIDSLGEFGTEQLDKFRSTRGIKPLTASKELEILRVFWRFCSDREWTKNNPAKKTRLPRNLKPNDVVPFTRTEIAAMVKACDTFGQQTYERLRVRAILLTLRYTALRIGDVSMLTKDRISRDGEQWRIFIRTEKSGQPVFLPVPPDLKAALDCVPSPNRNPDSRYFFWSEQCTVKTQKAHVDRFMRSLFKQAGIVNGHCHRWRHTLATELLGRGASFEDVADILGNSPEIIRKHYGKWSLARQSRIDDLMGRVYITPEVPAIDKTKIQ